MKNIFMLFLIIASACNQQSDLSPKATAQLAAESFYKENNKTLKEHTTEAAYNNLVSIQPLLVKQKDKEVNFKLVDQSVQDNIAWIKFKTSFEQKANTFKLVKIDGIWKVDNKKPSDQVPF